MVANIAGGEVNARPDTLRDSEVYALCPAVTHTPNRLTLGIIITARSI